MHKLWIRLSAAVYILPAIGMVLLAKPVLSYGAARIRTDGVRFEWSGVPLTVWAFALLGLSSAVFAVVYNIHAWSSKPARHRPLILLIWLAVQTIAWQFLPPQTYIVALYAMLRQMLTGDTVCVGYYACVLAFLLITGAAAIALLIDYILDGERQSPSPYKGDVS